MNTCALRPPSVVLNRVSRQYGLEVSPPPPHTLSQHRCHQQGPCHAFYFGEAAKREHGEHSRSEICFNIPPPSLKTGRVEQCQFFILEFTGRFCFLPAAAKSATVARGKKNPTTIEWLSKSSEIGTVSGRGIGQHNLSGALIRDMECEHRPSLRANKACTPPAAGI